MPLEFTTPPQKSIEVLQNALTKFSASDHGPTNAELAEAEVTPSSSSEKEMYPHAVYMLDFDDLLQGKGLEAATPVSWRYFVNVHGTGRAAEVNLAPQDSHIFASLSQGGIYETTREEFQKASSDPAVQKGILEPRLLRVFGLHVSALWLHSKSEDQEDIIRLVRRIPTFLKDEEYSRSQFETELHNAAKQKLAKLKQNSLLQEISSQTTLG